MCFGGYYRAVFRSDGLGVILLLPMLLTQPKQLSQGEMRVSVLDVGQGLSVAVQTAQHVMLYDIGQQYAEDNDS